MDLQFVDPLGKRYFRDRMARMYCWQGIECGFNLSLQILMFKDTLAEHSFVWSDYWCVCVCMCVFVCGCVCGCV